MKKNDRRRHEDEAEDKAEDADDEGSKRSIRIKRAAVVRSTVNPPRECDTGV